MHRSLNVVFFFVWIVYQNLMGITESSFAYGVASSAVFPRFDEALREKLSCRGLRFFGLLFALPFHYFGLVFGVTASVKDQDNCV